MVPVLSRAYQTSSWEDRHWPNLTQNNVGWWYSPRLAGLQSLSFGLSCSLYHGFHLWFSHLASVPSDALHVLQTLHCCFYQPRSHQLSAENVAPSGVFNTDTVAHRFQSLLSSLHSGSIFLSVTANPSSILQCCSGPRRGREMLHQADNQMKISI